jgi:hypothetical protein
MEYIVLNPRRADNHLGSFSINLRTGCWADFSSNDRGGDPVRSPLISPASDK